MDASLVNNFLKRVRVFFYTKKHWDSLMEVNISFHFIIYKSLCAEVNNLIKLKLNYGHFLSSARTFDRHLRLSENSSATFEISS